MNTAELALPEALGAPIKGPTALGNDPKRFWRLAWTLAITDFKLRFFGSALGYLWQLMRPLMLFGVLYVVFSEFLSFGGNVRYYPQALLLGIVLFGFFSEATAGAVRCLMAREPLVRKVDFPRLAVPTATVMVALFNLGLNLIPVFGFYLAAGGAVKLSWLEFPVLIVGLTVFAFSLAMLLSVLFVRYRDVEPIWDVVLQITFYATPIFYTLDVVSEKLGSDVVPKILLCNPFAAVLQQSRHAVIDPSHLAPTQVWGSRIWWLIPLGLIAALAVVGFAVFSHEAPKVAEEL
jgi:ABC-2 type transport system permease protein